MNLDDRQRAAEPLVHRPRHPLVAFAAALFLPSARAAFAVALERQRGARPPADLSGERCHPGTAALHSAADALSRVDPARSAGLVGHPGPRGSAPGGAVVMPLAMATCDLDRPVLRLARPPFPLPLHFRSRVCR